MPTIDVTPMTTPSTVSAERILLVTQRVDGHRRGLRRAGRAAESRNRIGPSSLTSPSRSASIGIAAQAGARCARIRGRRTCRRWPSCRGRAAPTTARCAPESASASTRACATPNPSSVPISPPTIDSVVDSVSTCQTMSRRLAPSALRRPISRVRSETTISMMFMMTMPPTTSDSETTPIRIAKMPCENVLPEVHQRVRRVHAEVVVVARAQVALHAQRHARVVHRRVQTVRAAPASP